MKTLIKILCLSSFLFAEDVYPYLSNPSKQLEFEKIRIYIEEVEEKEMYISGGSQTILLDAYEKKEGFTINQQMTTDAIQTDYRYIYNFEIKQNNKVFNELDLLFGIGLTEEAGKIINNYNEEYAIYKEEVNRLETNYKNELMQLEERKYAIGRKNKIVLGLSMIAGLALPDDNDFKYPVLGIGVIWLLISAAEWGSMDHPINHSKNLQAPTIKQTLTNEQLKSISESYNRKIFEEIKNK